MKRKIFLGCSLLAIGLFAGAQVTMEKDYDETFSVSQGNKVEISNKYGEVIIQTWTEPQVRIKGTIEAQGRNQDVVNKNMNRVRLEMRKIGQIISVETEIEKRGGTFTEVFNDVGEYSRSLFGNKKIAVNLEIWLPQDIDLSIINKYGDIYLASLDGEVDVTLAHGDLRADRLEGRLDMEHSFGKADFNFVNRGRFTLRGSETTIEEGSSFSFQSSSSEINLYNVHYVKLNSRNDRVKADQINELVGTGKFTEIEGQRVTRNVDLNLEFGEITLSQIEKKFKNISISSRATDIHLTLNQASYIDAEIRGDEAKMVVPNSMMALSRNFNEEDETVTLSGMLGPPQNYQSDLKIDSERGAVIISIKDTPVFTDRR